MSDFITQNGTVVTCADHTCSCNAPRPSALPAAHPHTDAGIAAVDEERWFSELTDAIEEYLHLYVQHRESPKADREALALKMHEAKTEVVSRFYAQGWGA